MKPKKENKLKALKGVPTKTPLLATYLKNYYLIIHDITYRNHLSRLIIGGR